MKNVLLLAIVLLTASVAAFAQGKKVSEVKIKTSAVCGMCKARIERDLSFEKGVKEAVLDLDTKVLTVSYDAKKTDEAGIRKAVTRIGYDADDQPADSKAYDNLPGCCKKDAEPHQ